MSEVTRPKTPTCCRIDAPQNYAAKVNAHLAALERVELEDIIRAIIDLCYGGDGDKTESALSGGDLVEEVLAILTPFHPEKVSP